MSKSRYMINLEQPHQLKAENYMKWHLTGNKNYHYLPEDDPSIQSVIDHLDDLTLPYPFQIGSTGYVEMTRPVPKGTFGKAIDAVGRQVLIVGEFFLFQRYIEGNLYMHTQTWIQGQPYRNSYYQVMTDWKSLQI